MDESVAHEPRWQFNPPPNWPVEPGFIPPEGWTPDPAWGPAPEAWTFWLPVAPSAGKPNRSRTMRIILAIAAAVLVVALLVVFLLQRERAAEELAAARSSYESSVAALEASLETAEEMLAGSENAVLDESSRDVLRSEMADAKGLAAVTVDQEDAAARSPRIPTS